MKNKELFTLNPGQVNLKNEGFTKIRAINESEDLSIVEVWVKTFVCEGEYHEVEEDFGILFTELFQHGATCFLGEVAFYGSR